MSSGLFQVLKLEDKMKELDQLRITQVAREKKKTELACDVVESLLDWMSVTDNINIAVLRQHRKALRALRS